MSFVLAFLLLLCVRKDGYLPTARQHANGAHGGGEGRRFLGRHVLNAGYDVRAYRLNVMPAMTDAGTYSFGTNYTKGPLDNSPAMPGPAQGLASMLLGRPTGGSINRAASSAIQSFYQGFFLQDDFKVTPRLTVNLGLQYEIELPTTERFNRAARGFDFTTPNPIETAARAAYAAKPDSALAPADFHVPNGLLFADARHRGIWDSKANLLQPRVGAAFQLTPKTVLRGGWGLYMIPFGLDGLFQPGFSQITNLVPTLDIFLRLGRFPRPARGARATTRLVGQCHHG